MKSSSIQNYISVLIVVFFLIVAVGGGLLIWPKFQESRILENDIKTKKEEIRQKEEYFKNLRELKIQLETDYLDELSKINAALSSLGSPMPSLLKFLQESSIQSGLLLKSVSPSMNDTSEKSNLKELKVDLDLEGSYSSFKNFLSVLENSSRLIETESISFSLENPLAQGETQRKTSSSFNLQIKAFSY